LDSKEKVDELFKFYQEIVSEELKNTYSSLVEDKLKEELFDLKISTYE
jgi:hypothetical protein